MSKKLWKSLLVNPALLSAALTASAAIGFASTASASEVQSDATAPSVGSLEQIKAYGSEGVTTNAAGQVTSVSQLSDVRPTDWAFQALQSLVERYGCIAGYPDRTYRGNRALTRYEFAAGLNACLDRVNELIAAATSDLVKKEDLATLQKLQEEFAAELATLRGRVDALEARTTTLERQQFSTTTKLQGEAIFSISGAQGGNRAVPVGVAAGSAGRVDKNTTFSDRVRLSLRTSFTGKDTLLTRLQARNITSFGTPVTGTNMARLSYEGSGSTGNTVVADKLFYRFPVGSGTITVDAVGGEFYNNVPNFNPLFASDSQGTISRFGRFNPIYRNGVPFGGSGGTGTGSGAGVTINLPIARAVTLSAGYLAPEAQDPTNGRGLLSGSYSALGQVAFTPDDRFGIGFTFVRSYFRGARPVAPTNITAVSGGTGSVFSDAPFGALPTATNNYGISGSFRFSPRFVISGWGGFTQAFLEGTGRRADIWNWAVTLGFPDLGGKGNLAGIVFGQPPKVTRNTFSGARDDNGGTSFLLEGLYRFQVSNNISITPGIIVIFNPEHNNNNDTVYLGTIRTTFTF